MDRRLLHKREARLAALDAALARGLADIEAGRVKPADEVFDRLEAKYRAMAETRERDRLHRRRRMSTRATRGRRPH